MQVLNNMTQDDQKVCVHCFVLKCNVSACNQDLSSKTEQAWITVCGHIFCASCGLAELGNLPIICPICSHMLTSPFDILKAELNPPSHFIKMVLMGLNPDDCLEAARSGIEFWNGQSKLQLNCLEMTVNATRLQLAEMQSHYEEKVAEMNREIVDLREECHRVKEELRKRSLLSSVQGVQSNFKTKQQQKVGEKPVEANASGTLKKQSYPPPSIPPHAHSSSRDNKPPKRQFLGKF